MWTEGTIGDYEYCAKVYDTPSQLGIDNGRVSKLDIYKNCRFTGKRKFIAMYDRGWEVKPKNMKLVNNILSIVTA